MQVHLPIASILLTTLLLQAQEPQKVPRPVPFVDPDLKTEVARPVHKPVVPVPAIQSASSVQSPPKTAPRPQREGMRDFVASPARGTVHYDMPQAGVLWAVGDTWKARFDQAGATYVPFLGSSAPQNYPLALALDSVRLGAERLPLLPGTVAKSGDRVTIERGSTQETYALDPNGIEQSFTFTTLPARDEIVVRLNVTSELAPQAGSGELRFGNELGGVVYGEAIAFDAAGSRSTVATVHAGGAIELRVPRDFVRDARLPLTIDPRITTFVVRTPTPPFDLWTKADVAYGRASTTTAAEMLVVYERAYSATDHDVYAQLHDSGGTLVTGSGSYLDSTSEYWTEPRVAFKLLGRRFLTVAERRVTFNSAGEIYGRLRTDAAIPSLGAPFLISGSEAGSKRGAVVGGDPNPAAPTYFLVAWERRYSTTDYDIHARLVTETNSTSGGVILVENSGSLDFDPQISRSNGSLGGFTNQDWILVWNQRAAPTDHDIYGARIHWDGTTTQAAFPIELSVLDETRPAVSTITDASTGGHHWLVAYERQVTSTEVDLFGRLFLAGVDKSGGVNLSALEGSPSGRPQRRPQLDSDGCRFAVTYEELYGGSDWDTYCSTFHIDGSQLAVSEARAIVANGNDPENLPRIASEWSSNWPIGGEPVGRMRYAIVYESLNAIGGVIYEGRRAAGGFTSVALGCGGLGSLGHSAQPPGLGAPLAVTMTTTSTTRALVVGLPLATPVSICPPAACRLGIDLTGVVVVPSNQVTLIIPTSPGLLGGTVGFQGADIAPTGCSFGLRVSDLLRVTIQ
jgi:hypothetical protein